MARPFPFPYAIDGSGRSAWRTEEQHLRGLIELVLFTAPGERVMRPDFGSGLLGRVFAPASEEIAAATELQVQAALQRWLGHLARFEAVEVRASGAQLEVSVRYTPHQQAQAQLHTVTREL